MANNKLYGYTPKMNKSSGKEGSTYSGAEEGNTYENIGNRLDRLNPYEFRKGMDYELVAIGCSRLAESTPEEREKATETVLKNLEENGGYYSALIHYETKFRGKDSKPSFKSWLKEIPKGLDRKNVTSDVRSKSLKSPNYSYKHTQMAKTDKMDELKEAIKLEIRSVLNEQGAAKAAAMADMEDEEGTSKKGKAKKDKPVRKDRFDREEEAIKDILFRVDAKIDKKFYCPEDQKTEQKGEEEDNTMKDPAKGSLLYIKDCLMKQYADLKDEHDGDLKKAKAAYDDLQMEANAEFSEVFKDFGEEFEKNDVGEIYVEKQELFQTIKKLQERLKLGLDKARAGVEEEAKGIRRQVAETEMTRTEALSLLNIIKENGISLREGSQNIKVYYEIAKAAYLEGVANALKL